MKRLLAGAAAAGLGLGLALAPAAVAQESIPGPYTGSRITTPAAVATSSPAITAQIVRAYNGNLQTLDIKTFITTPGGLPSGCGSAGEVELRTTVTATSQPNTAASTATASTPCNGTYGIRVQATLRNRLGGSTVDRATLIGSVNVVVPPSAVTGVDSYVEGGAVKISWDPYPSPPSDFTGYLVQVQSGDSWATVGTIPAGTESFTDSSPPGEGAITYRVLARRAGPGDDVTCECGGRTTVEIPGATTSTTAEPGQGGGGGSGGGTGEPGGSTSGQTDSDGTGGDTTSTTKAPVASSGGRTGGGRSFSALPRGQVGVGTKAPRLGTPTGANIPGLLTPDEGFDEELDYGDQELGSGDAEDGLSSFYYEGAGGRGMAVPVATGFVLFAWAVHLRYLARAARPATAAVPRGGERRSGKGHGGHIAGARADSGPARGPRMARPTKRGWA